MVYVCISVLMYVFKVMYIICTCAYMLYVCMYCMFLSRAHKNGRLDLIPIEAHSQDEIIELY